MNIEPITLYKKGANNQLRYWTIWCEDYEITTEWGIVGDGYETQDDHELIPYGKGGRTREEQCKLVIQSKINKRIDRGFVYDQNKAMNEKVTNSLGFAKPMLARKYNVEKDYLLDGSWWHQPKLDGHRCLVTRQNGEIIAYSRNGKLIESVDHIIDKIDIPEGFTIDGELYIHGVPLQQIASLIKRKQEQSVELRYYVYDCISSRGYSSRLARIRELDIGEYSLVLNASPVVDLPSLTMAMSEALGYGYEGLMLKSDRYGYEDDKRSAGLLKYKSFHDDEFKVIGMNESSDGWAVLICQMPNGNTFKTPAPGNMFERKEVLKNSHKYIGKYVNVKYANLTPDGIPFHPIATMWRNKFEE